MWRYAETGVSNWRSGLRCRNFFRSAVYVFVGCADCAGLSCCVPFGRSNARRVGMVLEIAPNQEDQPGLKPILSVLDETPAFESRTD